jgi:hypothetical protein
MNAEQKLTRDLRKIENRLQEVLQPIKPPAVFVSDLRERLDQEMIKKAKTKKVRTGLLVAGGVLGLVALIITIIRKLTSWEKLNASISKLTPKFRKRQQPASI